MNKKVMIIGFLVLSFSISTYFIASHEIQKIRQKNSPRIYGKAPEFTLTDQNGAAFEKKSLNGKMWLTNFIFTSCAGTCPMMTAKLKKISSELKGIKDLQIVSISVDPKRDDVKTLRKYAAKHKIENPNWHFLTGDESTIHRMIQKGFYLPSARRKAEGIKMEVPTHSDKFILVDRKGKIRGYYSPLIKMERKKLIAHAKYLNRN